jgi:hypothetical protein
VPPLPDDQQREVDCRREVPAAPTKGVILRNEESPELSAFLELGVRGQRSTARRSWVAGASSLQRERSSAGSSARLATPLCGGAAAHNSAAGCARARNAARGCGVRQVTRPHSRRGAARKLTGSSAASARLPRPLRSR